jgi:hypothetical protein
MNLKIGQIGLDKIYIDGANPSFIKSLKLQIGELWNKVYNFFLCFSFGDIIAVAACITTR